MDSQIKMKFSMGTAALLDTVDQLIAKQFDTVAINLGTLVRNRYTTGISVNTLHTTVKQELEEVIEFLCSAFQHYRVTSPYVLFYIPNYSVLFDKTLLRSISSSRLIQESVNKLIISEIYRRPSGALTPIDGVVFQQLAIVNPKIAVSNQLHHAIISQPNRHRTILASHIPVDFHLLFQLQSGVLVESFTGRVVERGNFSSKVFSSDKLPFYGTLHLLFGDKWLLQGTLTRKEKQTVIETAEKHRWVMKSDFIVRKELTQLGIKIPEDKI